MLLASSNFLVPNTTFIVELVIFLAVLGVLAKYVLPYLNRALDDRQQAIERNIREADEAKARAQELEEQRAHQLAQGREEARRLREEASKVGEQLRQELQKKGEEDYQRLVARAGADIEASVRRAAEELRAQMSELVVAVVERVLSQGISVSDQQRLVDQAIAEVEALSSAEATASASATGLAGGAGS
ncbi:MAG: F0F1 ATP synthase subunit B [Acidimicrobiales bacterium]|jgi:F-type H+-transporting ATPase subunit b